MARKPVPQRRAVTAARVARLYRLLKLVAGAAHTREQLLRQLRVNIRAFYRDMDALRRCGIAIPSVDGRYALTGTLDAALDRLPFPDPRLTLGQAQTLAKGKSAAHQALRERIDRITS